MFCGRTLYSCSPRFNLFTPRILQWTTQDLTIHSKSFFHRRHKQNAKQHRSWWDGSNRSHVIWRYAVCNYQLSLGMNEFICDRSGCGLYDDVYIKPDEADNVWWQYTVMSCRPYNGSFSYCSLTSAKSLSTLMVDSYVLFSYGIYNVCVFYVMTFAATFVRT